MVVVVEKKECEDGFNDRKRESGIKQMLRICGLENIRVCGRNKDKL